MTIGAGERWMGRQRSEHMARGSSIQPAMRAAAFSIACSSAAGRGYAAVGNSESVPDPV